jgi:dihydropteroate synthase
VSIPLFLTHAHGRLALETPAVMGVLNRTRDSFSDGGRFLELPQAIDHALTMVAEGAALIDIGGESTRPGAQAVSLDEELERVLPLIEALRARSPVLISVDTSRPEVIHAAVAAGAVMINDVRALQRPGALQAAAASGAAVCLMHMQGEPATMQSNPHYQDVVGEVRSMLAGRLAACEAAGISAERICLDPGFGFGKLISHNLALLRGLGQLLELGRPLLVGLSRKSMLQKLTGRAVGERLAGSLALATTAVLQGARIIRAHDVAPTVDAVRVAAAVLAQAP